MKVDFSRKLLSLKGTPLIEGDEEITLGGVVGNLLAVLPTEEKTKGAERKKRFLLSIKVYSDNLPVDLDEADIQLIKDLVDKSSLPPLYAEQIIYALEGKRNPLSREVEPPMLKEAAE